MNEGDRAAISRYLPTLTVVSVALLGLLFLADDHTLRLAGVRLGPAALGIAGLVFVAAALMTFDRQTVVKRIAVDDAIEAKLVPLLIECGLWAIAAAFVLRLLELARG